jgi:hypothetical protein
LAPLFSFLPSTIIALTIFPQDAIQERNGATTTPARGPPPVLLILPLYVLLPFSSAFLVLPPFLLVPLTFLFLPADSLRFSLAAGFFSLSAFSLCYLQPKSRVGFRRGYRLRDSARRTICPLPDSLRCNDELFLAVLAEKLELAHCISPLPQKSRRAFRRVCRAHMLVSQDSIRALRLFHN